MQAARVAAVLVASLALASAFQPILRAGLQPKLNRNVACGATMHSEFNAKKAAAGLAALPLAFLLSQSAGALTTQDIRDLTYGQIKGTGIANRCPEVANADKAQEIVLDKGSKYKIVDLCLEPKSFQIEEEIQKRKGEVRKEFVDTKLMTRATYSLTGMEGPLFFDKDGQLTFLEKDGIDYAPTTVQLPGGERVPFMFTVKQLEAKSTSPSGVAPGTEFGGTFTVPSYRSGLFLDPKGRGGTTGYDNAGALVGLEADGSEGQEDLFKETNKVYQVTEGSIEFAVNKVDGATGEFSGVFVSEQLSDTDMGSKAPKKVLLKGIIFGRVAAADGTEDY